jgi:hypothetical protein
MPTVLREGPYRFFFFSREPNEPPHIHVERDDSYAKFWVNPVSLARNRGFKSHELTELRTIIEANAQMFEERWHEHLRDQGGPIRG